MKPIPVSRRPFGLNRPDELRDFQLRSCRVGRGLGWIPLFLATAVALLLGTLPIHF